MDPVESPPFLLLLLLHPVLSLARLSWRQMYTRDAMLSVAASRSLTPSSLSLSFFILFPCRAFLPSCLPPFHLRHSFVPLIFMSPTRNVAEGRIMARRRRRGERRRTEETSEQRARALPPPSSWARYRSAAMIGLVQVYHGNERQVGEKRTISKRSRA